MEYNSNLSDFFSVVISEKKKKKDEFDSIVGDLDLNSIFEEVTTLKKKNKIKKKKEEKAIEVFENWLYSDKVKDQPIKKVQEVVKDVIEEVQEIVDNIIEDKKEESTLIERSLGLLSEPSNKKVQSDPLTPLDKNFATLEDLQNHYKLFISRIQQQLSTIDAGSDSAIEYKIDGGTYTGGRVLASGFLSGSNQGSTATDILKEELFRFQLERDALIGTPYELSLVASADTNGADIFASMDWEEISR